MKEPVRWKPVPWKSPPQSVSKTAPLELHKESNPTDALFKAPPAAGALASHGGPPPVPDVVMSASMRGKPPPKATATMDAVEKAPREVGLGGAGERWKVSRFVRPKSWGCPNNKVWHAARAPPAKGTPSRVESSNSKNAESLERLKTQTIKRDPAVLYSSPPSDQEDWTRSHSEDDSWEEDDVSGEDASTRVIAPDSPRDEDLNGRGPSPKRNPSSRGGEPGTVLTARRLRQAAAVAAGEVIEVPRRGIRILPYFQSARAAQRNARRLPRSQGRPLAVLYEESDGTASRHDREALAAGAECQRNRGEGCRS